MDPPPSWPASNMAPESSLKRPRAPSAQASPQLEYNQLPTAPPSPSPAASPLSRRPPACEPCRRRKQGCDKALPTCERCRDAGLVCESVDPLTGRVIPRNHIANLEERVIQLQSLLESNRIPYPLADESSSAGGSASATARTSSSPIEGPGGDGIANGLPLPTKGMRSTTGSPRSKPILPPFVKSTFAAGRDTNGTSHETAISGTSIRNTFSRLDTQSAHEPAPFPEESLGRKFVDLYFEHANPQIPILHRGEFNELVEWAYSTDSPPEGPRELYLLNLVFAIGAGIFLDKPNTNRTSPQSPSLDPSSLPPRKRAKSSPQEYGPEHYHAAAIRHLELFLRSSPAAERPTESGLEELQAVLLLAGLSLLRPIAPGLWFIVGVAVKLAIDLGLHRELPIGIESTMGRNVARAKQNVRFRARKNGGLVGNSSQIDSADKGRLEWTQDLRRRLWWCVYSFDRLASTCLGRPLGIPDDIVTTKFPSLLDDVHITRTGIITPPAGSELPSYKLASHHYVQFRLLQSEILQVLQHQKAQQVWKRETDKCLRSTLQSPFLLKHDTFHTWRTDMDRRLTAWKDSAPAKIDTGVEFSLEFLELEYWQATLMLYRQSITVREDFQKTNGKKSSEEDHDLVFRRVALAGSSILKLYRKLQSLRLVNYTFLATQQIYIAGILFLDAIWHSEKVREELTLGEFQSVVEGAKFVFDALSDQCKPAIGYKQTLARLSSETVKKFFSTSGSETTQSTPGKPNPTEIPHRAKSNDDPIYEPSGRASISTTHPNSGFDQGTSNMLLGGFLPTEGTDMGSLISTSQQQQPSEFQDYTQDPMDFGLNFNSNYYTSPSLEGSQRWPFNLEYDLLTQPMFIYNSDDADQFVSGGPRAVLGRAFL